jgi:hypothetical protein
MNPKKTKPLLLFSFNNPTLTKKKQSQIYTSAWGEGLLPFRSIEGRRIVRKKSVLMSVSFND